MVQTLIDRGSLLLHELEERTPQGRLGEVTDILGVAVFLASGESSFITGTVVTPDGGWTAYGCL